jgi:hypothetical protein
LLAKRENMLLRKLVAVSIALILSVTTVACDSSASRQIQETSNNNSVQTQIGSGKYPVQQATYDDANGEYTLMLLNATPPVFRTANLQMARLTDDAIAKGEKTYVEIDGDRASMYLSEDFKIEYVHNVTETQTNPQTGQPETVVVRQESNFWTPFAGALAGQALGSLLFRPQYYVPPVYQTGAVMRGYGGYGNNYNSAVESYRRKYNQAPVAVRNRQTLRTTGNIRKNTSERITRRRSPNSSKSSGSGYGSSTLRQSDRSGSVRKRNSSFGSSSTRRRVGSSRRRR